MNIKISQFKKRYRSQLIQIKDMELSKRIVILKGKNGSGKSTLLKAIADLIHYEGVIKHKHTISFIPDYINYPKGILLIDYLMLFNKLDSYDQVLYNKLILKFKLKSHLNKDVSELSKGMKMKTNILLGLCLNREVYLLDEPFNGLDKKSRSELINHINRSSKAFIITTHQKEEVDIQDYQEVRIS